MNSIYSHVYDYLYTNIENTFFIYGDVNLYRNDLEKFCNMYCNDIVLKKLYDLYTVFYGSKDFNNDGFINSIKLYIPFRNMSYSFYLFLYDYENYMEVYNKLLYSISRVDNKAILRILFTMFFNSAVYDCCVKNFNDIVCCFNNVFNKNINYRDLVLYTIDSISNEDLLDNVYTVRDDVYSYLIYGMFSMTYKNIDKDLAEIFMNTDYNYLLRSIVLGKYLNVRNNVSLNELVYLSFIKTLFENIRKAKNILNELYHSEIYHFVISLFEIISLDKLYKDIYVNNNYNKLFDDMNDFNTTYIYSVFEFYKNVLDDEILRKYLKRIFYKNFNEILVIRLNNIDKRFIDFYKKYCKENCTDYADVISKSNLNVLQKIYYGFDKLSKLNNLSDVKVFMKDIIELHSEMYFYLLSIALNCKYTDLIMFYGNEYRNIIDPDIIKCKKNYSSLRYIIFEFISLIYIKVLFNALRCNSVEIIENFNNNMYSLVKIILNSSSDDIKLRFIGVLCISLDYIGESLLYDNFMFSRFYNVLMNICNCVDNMSIDSINNIIKESIYVNIDVDVFDKALNNLINLL